MKEKILVVDDEHEIADLISLYLKNEDYETHTFYASKEALATIQKECFDLAILDVMLPEINGFTLCSKIREKYHYPIIMLTAKAQDMDRIHGLTLGADDYMSKPFNPLELIARVKAQLRRYKKYNQPIQETSSLLTYQNLILDIQQHTCTLLDHPLTLTPTEFTILKILLEHQGSVVSSEDLFHGLWNDEYYHKANNTITVHIRHLREKMKEIDPEINYIQTVWGIGYKIER